MNKEVQDLYRSIHVPVPTKAFAINPKDKSEEVCAKLDALFDDITQGYPADTRNLVRAMYYEDTGVFPLHGLVVEQSAFAMWQIFQDEETVDGVHVTFIDQALIGCPITAKFCKMHEIAGHAGQAHQRISQIGLDGFLVECSSGVFNSFTDQSVSLAEKVILDAMPMHILQRDLRYSPDAQVAKLFLNEFGALKRFDYEDYSLLLHRVPFCPVAANLSVESHERFHEREDVAAFDDVMNEGQTSQIIEKRVMINRSFPGLKK